MEKTQSAAYLALRPSSRRLLRFIEMEIQRQGGGRVLIFNDQFEMIGSRKVYVPGLSELHSLGLLSVARHPKQHTCALSDRWRDIETANQATTVSARARVRPMPPTVSPAA